MSKEKKSIKKDKKRFTLPEPPQEFKRLIGAQFPTVVPAGCEGAME